MAANGCCRCRGSWRSSFDRSRIGSGERSRSRPQPRLSRLRTRSMLRRSKGQGWGGKGAAYVLVFHHPSCLFCMITYSQCTCPSPFLLPTFPNFSMFWNEWMRIGGIFLQSISIHVANSDNDSFDSGVGVWRSASVLIWFVSHLTSYYQPH